MKRSIALGVMLVVCGSLAEAAQEPTASSANHTQRISTEAFLASPFARFFQAEDYPNALKALERLLKRYPNDPLILRYRARVLARLGRTTDAIALYQRLVSKDPRHAPTRIFLGEAYLRNGQSEAAAEQWRWVIQHSDSKPYRRWAQAQLNRLRVKGKRVEAPRQRLYLVGETGFKYDSNPLVKPDDEALAVAGNEKHGFKIPLDVTVGYPLVLTPEGRLDVLYLSRQMFHDGETDDVDLTTQGAAIVAKRRVHMGRRAVILAGRYGARVNFLRSDLLSVVNRFLVSADTAFTPHTRTHVYGRASLANFGPDGSNPPQTSRDGFRGGLGATQYFYTEDFRRYLFVSQEVSLQETRGANHIRRGTASRVGIHTPVPWVTKTDFDFSTGFQWGRYPKFDSVSSLDNERRRDARFDVYT
ncbi:MAG: tetratricopeptide repeat protein, partial [Candidatus Binatota bacterium]